MQAKNLIWYCYVYEIKSWHCSFISHIIYNTLQWWVIFETVNAIQIQLRLTVGKFNWNFHTRNLDGWFSIRIYRDRYTTKSIYLYWNWRQLVLLANQIHEERGRYSIIVYQFQLSLNIRVNSNELQRRYKFFFKLQKHII